MDGYSKQAMEERCLEDYGWRQMTEEVTDTDEDRSSSSSSSSEALASERAAMMSYLYDDDRLWEHVCMVAFAEHYVLTGNDEGQTSRPYAAFSKKRVSRPEGAPPIFGGVVLTGWQSTDDNDEVERKLSTFRKMGIDYVRLECNMGTEDDVGEASRFIEDPLFTARFDRLAEIARRCQKREMIPLVLLQVPWRDTRRDSTFDHFDRSVRALAASMERANVEPRRTLLETRPPVGLSAQEESDLDGTKRTSLGLNVGERMFEVLADVFDDDGGVAGFCVAGGSTKGARPTAMEDDTQNAVRQGMRQRARRKWGRDLCFWEMGAKRMLQPEVGRLWGSTDAGRDAARELFLANAKDMADEIAVGA